VLQDVDLVVEPGQCVGVTGPLDSGWRSLLRLVVGLDPATGGGVALDGPARGLEERRQDVVLASALDPLLDGDAARTVARLFRLDASRRRRVGATSWNAIVAGAGVAEANGPWTRGERLRLCVALASALGPSHLLLEIEPPLGSDADREAFASLARRASADDRGVVLGTRDELLLAMVAEKVLIFEDGAVLAEGAPESVLAAAWKRARDRGPA
jgi:energy-coupling factor transporter ATP-binding protein EcfA2